MIGNSHSRAARSRFVFAAFVTILGTSSCAAPDARPAPEEEFAPPAGQPIWGLGFGENTNDQRAFDVALDSTTDTIVSTMGFINGILIPDLNAGMPFTSGGVVPPVPVVVQNILVLKYAAKGSQPLWATPINAAAEIIRSTVDIDFQGNAIVAGGFNGTLEIPGLAPIPTAADYDAYIAKFDPTGKPLWVHTFGDPVAQFVTDVATDAEGNIIVVGMARGEAFTFGNGVIAPKVTDADIFVAKFDSAAKAIWAKRVGPAGSTEWRDPTVTVAVSRVDGSIIVGGSHSGTLDFSPQQVAAAGLEDGFVVKLDAQGQGLWSLEFGDKGQKQRVTSVAIGPSGEVLLTGWFMGSVSLGGEVLTSYKESEDLLVAKLDVNGKYAWSRGYGHLGKQMGSSVMVDEKGHALVAGSFAGDIEFFGNDALINTNVDATTDIFAAKFSVNGTPFWARSYGDVNPLVAASQAVGGAVLWKERSTGENRAVLVGMNGASIDLGEDMPAIASQGLEDVFMMSITH